MERKQPSYMITDEKGGTYADDEPGMSIQLNDATVLRATKSGTLTLCDKCTRHEWQCTTYPNGDTWCTQVCVEWECRVVPALNDLANLLR